VLLYERARAVQRAQEATGTLAEAAEPAPAEEGGGGGGEEGKEGDGGEDDGKEAEDGGEGEEGYDTDPDPPMQLPRGSLRLSFGRDGHRCGVRCSANAAVAAAERHFIFSAAGQAQAHHGAGHGEERSREARRRDWADRPTRVAISSLLSFVFPERVQHPLSRCTGRSTGTTGCTRGCAASTS